MSPLNKLPFTFQFSSEPHLPMRLSVGSFLLVLACSWNCAALADSEKPRGITDIPASRSCGHVNPFTSKRILLPATLSPTCIFKTTFKWCFPQSLSQPLQPVMDCSFLHSVVLYLVHPSQFLAHAALCHLALQLCDLSSGAEYPALAFPLMSDLGHTARSLNISEVLSEVQRGPSHPSSEAFNHNEFYIKIYRK